MYRNLTYINNINAINASLNLLPIGLSQMTNKNLALKVFEQGLATCDIEVVHYLDRLRLHFDARCDLDKILTPKAKIEVKEKSLPNHPSMIFVVDICQPRAAHFKALRAGLTGNYMITYIEVAMDLITPSTRKQEGLTSLIAKHLVHERPRSSKQFYFGEHNGTTYSGRRGTHAVILASYSEVESRVYSGKPCVHLEIRLSGSTELKRHGFYTLEDVATVNVEEFWLRYLDFRRENFQQLASLLQSTAQSDTGKRNYVMPRLAEHPSLQSFLQDNPLAAPGFSFVNTRRKFESLLAKYLS